MAHLRNLPLKLSWEASFQDSYGFYTLAEEESRLDPVHYEVQAKSKASKYIHL